MDRHLIEFLREHRHYLVVLFFVAGHPVLRNLRLLGAGIAWSLWR